MRILITLLLTAATIVSGQNGKLAGKIYDSATGEPILAASIYLEDTKLGAASIGKGNILLPKSRKGNMQFMLFAEATIKQL